MIRARCDFCGRDGLECPGGLWRPKANSERAICRYCLRVGLRALSPYEPEPTRGIAKAIIERLETARYSIIPPVTGKVNETDEPRMAGLRVSIPHLGVIT